MPELTDVSRVEAPVGFKTYLMCAFAAFGGIFFGYDSGYINGVMGMEYFIKEFEGLVCRPLAVLPMFGCEPVTNRLMIL